MYQLVSPNNGVIPGGPQPGNVRQQFGGLLASALLLTAVCASAQVAPPPAPTDLPPTIPTNVASIKALPALPAGFDALTASQEALRRHGLPPRPDQVAEEKGFKAWKAMVTNAKIHVEATLTQMPNIFHKPAQLTQPQGTISQSPPAGKNQTVTYSYNWSGPVIYDANKPFATSYILGYWIVPRAQQTFRAADSTWDYSSQWVGIDGFGSNDVLQAGTEVDAFDNGAGGTAQFYSFWIEWYPFSETRVDSTKFPVSAGDTVIVEVWNTSPTNGYAFLENLSTGKWLSFNLQPPNGTSLQGTSAEWVVERPSVNGSLARLTNYVGDAFTYCYAGGYNYRVTYYPGDDFVPTGTVYLVDMLDNNNKVISYPVLNGLFGIWFFDAGSAY